MIRHTIKHFLINAVSLYLISLAISGLIFTYGIKTILLTAVALGITSVIAKPIINILLLPINLLTFGLFRWVSYAVTLYIVTLIVPGFKIIDFIFRGYSSTLFVIPAISLHGIPAFIAFSFVIAFTSSLLDWLLK